MNQKIKSVADAAKEITLGEIEMIKSYSGILDFADDSTHDFIRVTRLIVRGVDVSFHGTATWNMETHWVLDTIARPNGGGYVSNPTCPKQGSEVGHPVVLCLSKLEPTQDGLFVEGSWTVSGNAFAFSGELDPLSLNDQG